MHTATEEGLSSSRAERAKKTKRGEGPERRGSTETRARRKKGGARAAAAMLHRLLSQKRLDRQKAREVLTHGLKLLRITTLEPADRKALHGGCKQMQAELRRLDKRQKAVREAKQAAREGKLAVQRPTPKRKGRPGRRPRASTEEARRREKAEGAERRPRSASARRVRMQRKSDKRAVRAERLHTQAVELEAAGGDPATVQQLEARARRAGDASVRAGIAAEETAAGIAAEETAAAIAAEETAAPSGGFLTSLWEDTLWPADEPIYKRPAVWLVGALVAGGVYAKSRG